MSDAPLIEISNVWKVFGAKPEVALRAIREEGLTKDQVLSKYHSVVGVADVSLSVNRGEIFCIMGLSGSGKSTLVRHFNRLLEPTAGKILVEGTDVMSLGTKELQHFRNRKIGMVFQNFALMPHRSVLDNVALPLEIRQISKNDRMRQAAAILDIVELGAWGSKFAHELSGGMQQRVGLARALAANPDVLLMDEPLAALDVARKREFLPFLEKLHDTLKMPVIYVSHSPTEVARLADHIVLLKEGRVEATGPLNHTLSRLDLSSQMDEQASVIIEARIEQLQSEWHLAEAAFEGGSMWVRDMNFVIGSQVRLQVLARDVSLTLSPDKDSSIANTIEAIIEEVGAGDHPAILLVRLKIGANFLLSRLTSRSFHHLGVSVGDKVWAQIKSAAIIE